MKHFAPRRTYEPSSTRFIFATGIECSYPTVQTPRGRVRVDQLEKCRHYQRWHDDLRLVREDLGLRFLRYGVPYYRIHTAPDQFDWSFTDEVLPEMRRMGIVPILDLCHFGVPDWVGDFQNPDFPRHFAAFARAFAERYPWVWCYTPVNEMYITAEFSAWRGWWNERLTSHRGFVTALKHLARACVEAMLAIVQVRRDALFVLAESSERTHARCPEMMDEAEFHNERRFLSLDLVCGRRPGAGIYEYVRSNGMTEQEYLFFFQSDLREHVIMGHDYYQTNEYVLDRDGTREPGGDILGYYVLARQYHERYGAPVMLTETNARGGDSLQWLWKTWANVRQLRADGMPLCGMTWYSLTHQVDWDTTLREVNDRTYPVGLYDLDRNICPAGEEFKRLVNAWKNLPLVPNGPLTLVGDWAAAEHEDR